MTGTTTTFTDTGPRGGTTYFYNVAARNRVGMSADSNEASVTPRGAVAARPAGTATPPGSRISRREFTRRLRQG